MALVCAEILLQPDFGTFMVFVAILFGVLLVSGVQLRWLLVLVLIGVVGTVGMFKLNVLREYQKERLTAFIDPGADDSGRGFTYNSRQALIAIGSGGVTGKGYMRGTQPNLQYVPEQKTDFIFTVVGEDVDLEPEAAQELFLGDPEPLLFIENHEAELLRDHVAREDPVRPDEDVDFSFGKVLQDCLDVSRRSKTRDHLYRHR